MVDKNYNLIGVFSVAVLCLCGFFNLSAQGITVAIDSLEKEDISGFEIKCHWAIAPYVEDGSLNYVSKIDFIDTKIDSIITSYEVIRKNPFLSEEKLLDRIGVTDDGFCYSPYYFISNEKVNPIFDNAENIQLYCPEVRYNKHYVSVIYNVACRVKEHPFKYLSKIIIFDKYGNRVYDSGITEKASFRANISEGGDYLFYSFEGFKSESYYPDDTSMEFISLNEEYELKRINPQKPMSPIWYYLIRDTEKASLKIMIFDTRTLEIYTKGFSFQEEISNMDIINNEVIILTKDLEGEQKKHILDLNDFSRSLFSF